MDDAIRNQYDLAQSRIERERNKRGLPGTNPFPRPKLAPVEPERTETLADVIGRLKAASDASAEETDRELAELKAADDERARYELRQRLAAMRLPITAADERRLLAGDLLDTRSLRGVKAFLRSPKPLLMLLGAVGRGKTFAASWALTQAKRPRYVAARELERIFAARYGDEVDAQKSVLNTGLLVIDDVGRERDAEGMSAALLDVVDARRGRQKTIVISNYDQQQFQERYGDPRLLSRLHESAAWLVEKGEDMRRAAK